MIPAPILAFFEKASVPLTLASGTLPDQPLLLVNDAFCAMSGHGRDDVIGRNCRFLQGPSTETPARRELRQAIEGGHDCQAVITNYRRDGAEFANLLFLYALTDETGKARFFMGSQFELRARAGERELVDHAGWLDAGIAAIMARTEHVHVKTRQLLSEAAVAVVRARIRREA